MKSLKLWSIGIFLILALMPKVSWTITPLQLTREGESLTLSSRGDDADLQKVFRVPGPLYRLPNELVPYHYELRLRPRLTHNPEDLPQWTAPAQVTIFATCEVPTVNITLHSGVREIHESSVTVTNIETGLGISISGHSYDPEKNFYIIKLQTSLEIGQRYKIFIDYVANVHTDRMDGIYRSHYDDPLENGVRKWYATTQLQAFGARAVFPCFDEPALKATFDVTIGRESNFSVVANTPLISSTPIPGLTGWYWDTFKRTVPMSTYLIALVISDYTFAEASRDLYRKPTRTYGPKFLMNQGYGEFPSMIAAMDLAWYEEFLDYEYSLDKMDSAAMWDFATGAMENWGLNLYRDYLLLYGPNQDNERERRQIAQTLAHELAHQWFGNLVTCGWWTGAWLNEGFASYFQYHALNHTNPEFTSLKTMQNDAMQNAMRSDYLPNSHPTLLPDKGNPYDTMVYVGNLVYSKGAALLRMVEHFLTPETLQTALRTYLKRHEFGAVYQDDLFQVLDEQAQKDSRLPEGLTMKAIMDSWTLQKSYPLVKVTHLSGRNSVVLSQEEDSSVFRGSTSAQVQGQNQSIWYIPMAVATQSQPQPENTFPQYWFNTKEGFLPHNYDEWIVVNSGATGYYRVEYDAVLTQRLQEQLIFNHEVFNYGTRSQLLDDYFSRAYTGNQQIGAALGFTRHFDKELEYNVWAPFFYHMAKPYKLFAGTDTYGSLKKYIMPKIRRVLDKLRKTRDINFGIDNLLHAQLSDWACAMGELQCVGESLRLFEQWRNDPSTNPIKPLLRKVVYCTAIANHPANFQFALERFGESNGTQKTDLLGALGCATDAESIKLLLGAADGSNPQIAKQFALGALQSVAANHLHRGKLSDFLRGSIRDVVDYFGDATIIANSVKSLSSVFSTAGDLTFVNALVAENADLLKEPEIAKIIEASIEAIEENILWMARFQGQFHSWFHQHANILPHSQLFM